MRRREYCWSSCYLLSSDLLSGEIVESGASNCGKLSKPQSENLDDFDLNCVLSKLLYYLLMPISIELVKVLSGLHYITSALVTIFSLHILFCNHQFSLTHTSKTKINVFAFSRTDCILQTVRTMNIIGVFHWSEHIVICCHPLLFWDLSHPE